MRPLVIGCVAAAALSLAGCSTADQVASDGDGATQTVTIATPAVRASVTASPFRHLALDQQAVRDGDRVGATSRIVLMPGHPAQVCGNNYNDGVLRIPPLPPQPCIAGTDIVGVDPASLANARTRDGATEGWATVEGTWRDGVLHVDRQQQPTPPIRASMWDDSVPCPEPADGWPATGPGDNLPAPGERALGAYYALHPDVNDGFLSLLRPSRGKLVLGLAVHSTAERADAERLLRPTLGDGLCLVQATVSRKAVSSAEADPALRVGPGSVAFGSGIGVTDRLEPEFDVSLTMITPELRAAADRHPAGLVHIEATVHRSG